MARDPGTATIHIADGDAQIEVEPSPLPVSHNVATLIVTVDGDEIELTLGESERRELVKALGGRL
jgi:hypothetical protein